jgi:hypothetical protein
MWGKPATGSKNLHQSACMHALCVIEVKEKIAALKLHHPIEVLSP